VTPTWVGCQSPITSSLVEVADYWEPAVGVLYRKRNTHG
jgi:hypothetical protein